MARLLITDDLPIRVTRRGAWLHGNEPLHPKVQKLFQKNTLPKEDGGYIIKLGFNEHVLEVDDTPYEVVHMALETAAQSLAQVRLTTSDEHQELLDVSTLMQAHDNTFYCTIERGGFRVPCRFSQGQYHSLALHMEAAQEGIALRVGQQVGVVKPFEKTPQRLSS